MAEYLDKTGLGQVLQSVKTQDLSLASMIGERADVVQLEYDSDAGQWLTTAKKYDQNGVATANTVNIDAVLSPEGNDIDAIYGKLFSTFITPDYARQETTNRITSNNGTWTVDRDGFVYCHARTVGVALTYVYINGKEVAKTSAAFGYAGGIFAVKTGDVVKLHADDPQTPIFDCYFIPPRIVLDTETIEGILASVDTKIENAIDGIDTSGITLQDGSITDELIGPREVGDAVIYPLVNTGPFPLTTWLTSFRGNLKWLFAKVNEIEEQTVQGVYEITVPADGIVIGNIGDISQEVKRVNFTVPAGLTNISFGVYPGVTGIGQFHVVFDNDTPLTFGIYSSGVALAEKTFAPGRHILLVSNDTGVNWYIDESTGGSGSGGSAADLTDYYTKAEVQQIVQDAVQQAVAAALNVYNGSSITPIHALNIWTGHAGEEPATLPNNTIKFYKE